MPVTRSLGEFLLVIIRSKCQMLMCLQERSAKR